MLIRERPLSSKYGFHCIGGLHYICGLSVNHWCNESLLIKDYYYLFIKLSFHTIFFLACPPQPRSKGSLLSALRSLSRLVFLSLHISPSLLPYFIKKNEQPVICKITKLIVITREEQPKFWRQHLHVTSFVSGHASRLLLRGNFEYFMLLSWFSAERHLQSKEKSPFTTSPGILLL